MRIITLHPDYAEAGYHVRSLCFHPREQHLAAVINTPMNRNEVIRYDLARDAGRVIPDLDEDDEVLENAPLPALSADLEIVAEVVLDETGYRAIRVTDTWSKPPEVRRIALPTHDYHFDQLSITPDGSTLLVSCRNNFEWTDLQLFRWDLEALFASDSSADAELPGYSVPEVNESAHMVVAPDSRTLLVLAHDVLWVYDLAGKLKSRCIMPSETAINRGHDIAAILVTPDSRQAILGIDQQLKCWDLGSAQLMRSAPLVHDRAIRAAAMRPDGQQFALIRSDYACVTLIDYATLKPVRHFDWNVGPLYSVAYSPDGLTCAAGGKHGQVILWDLDD